MTVDIEAARQRVAELLTEYRIPSAAVGIRHGGRITEFAVGVRDVTTGAPATVDTIYQCGSMTKTWTALAFLRMCELGPVALDEPVRTWLPEFTLADSRVAAALTPRQLLNHTSGIEESFGDPGEGEDVYARMVANIADAPQVFPLGHTHGYSPALGYAILARIMEVAGGAPWHDILRRLVFEPLGQRDTTCLPWEVDRERAATGHVVMSPEQGPVPSPVEYLPRAYGPGGWVNSTVRDVLALAGVFLGTGGSTTGAAARAGRGPGALLAPASVREMMDSRVPVPDPYLFGPEWALGLIVCDWQGHTVFASDGSTIGHNARLRIFPEHDLAITVLTNGGPRESFAARAFDAILAGLDAPRPPEPPKPDPALRLDPARYVGEYSRPGTRFEVTARGDRLRLALLPDPVHARILGGTDRLEYDLLPISETHFLVPPSHPDEDPQTLALYDFGEGTARYLHINCRVHPRGPA
ncbi:beta-lactamase family protein [Nocardia sp. 2]|uniref:Beta-lactamase family protein n=1 Tax=Nocardia acididurans TaxID=2802282 RepID=A0ABS1M438_9NOCA|nr:serine hydrolase domain-containing protein [Nocardia acididurans]MBL1073898.1 beta-lactamase family protein [Nocardia acididurans]